MNTFAAVVFFAALAAASAGLIAPSAKILQGPSSKTTLVGPEGSIISSAFPGGQVITEEHPGVVAHAAPIVAHAAPVVVAPAPAVYAAPVPVAPAPAVYAAPVPVAHGLADVVIAGPSGTIATSKSYAAPAPVAHPAPLVAAVVFSAGAGHGGEGEYVHDYSESLYDDGSYKPHLH